MSNTIITQDEITLLKQKNKVLYSKLEVLDLDMKILKSIENLLINDDISITADSNARRTYNATLLHGREPLLDVGHGKFIWLNRRIRPYIGYYHQRKKQIVWYLLGTFAFDSATYNYSQTTNEISVSCSDLMTLLDGTHGGEFEGLNIKVEIGTNARKFIIDTLTTIGIKNYYIEGMNYEIPSDLEFDIGSSVYDIFKEIIEIYGGYEMFFDVNGTFIIQPIPNNDGDICILDDTIIQPLLIDESVSVGDFSAIYNHIIVYGASTDPDFTTEAVSYGSGVYNAVVEGYQTEYVNGDKVALRLPSQNSANAKININDIGAIPIVLDENNTPVTKDYFSANEMYVFRYRRLTNDFIYVGQYQCVGEAWDNNPDSPFCVKNLGYEKVHQLSGSDYEKIHTNDLCRQRAEYEIYKATNLQYTTTLNMITIPWLDVNKKIEFTSVKSGKKEQFIIQSISGSFSEGTMSVTASKFYPEHPQIVDIKGLK